MAALRSRVFVAIFFGLITLGQAYPYSYAWAAGQHAECGCNVAGRRCVHGCDLKKHSHEDPDHGGHASHGSVGEDHSMHREADQAQSLDDSEGAAHEWVAPDCARQTRRQILSFHGDPFLPTRVPLAFRPQERVSLIFQPISKISWKASPEIPPPRA